MPCSDSRHWISDVKFAPNGKSFVVASMDHKIYIYNGETYRLKGTCDRHNSHIKEVSSSLEYSTIFPVCSRYVHAPLLASGTR